MIYPGKKCGQLTVLRFSTIKKSCYYWECRCNCGTIKVIKERSLDVGDIKSCTWCNWREKQPHAYSSWDNMIQRCTNPNATGYQNYGGRGITVCSEWKEHFFNFFSDMGTPPIDPQGRRYTLDREDVNGPYNKENCKWSTKDEQLCNRRETRPEGVAVRFGDKIIIRKGYK